MTDTILTRTFEEDVKKILKIGVFVSDPQPIAPDEVYLGVLNREEQVLTTLCSCYCALLWINIIKEDFVDERKLLGEKLTRAEEELEKRMRARFPGKKIMNRNYFQVVEKPPVIVTTYSSAANFLKKKG